METDLEWIQDNNRRWLIRFVADGGYREAERWEDLHIHLAETMAQFEDAVSPYLTEAQQAAKRLLAEETDA